jgi:hypothetical protein
MPNALVQLGDTRIYDVVDAAFEVAPPFEWIGCPAGVQAHTHIWNGTDFLPWTPTGESPPRWAVLKSTIRKRLRLMGKEDDADAARALLPVTDQQEWAEAIYIESDDAKMIAFLQALGANHETVLAIDPAAGVFRL